MFLQSRLESPARRSSMRFEFTSQVIEWRGPAPFLFLPVPPEIAAEIRSVANLVSYGWGCIPVRAQIGNTRFETSLFPRDGTYLVPVKVAVQRAEGIGLGDATAVSLEFEVSM